MAKKKKDNSQIVAQNRKARHNYEILEEVEAGIALVGTEVKSLRAGKANIVESYAEPKDGELWLLNAYIPEYGKAAKDNNHNPHRPRKLLLHKREIKKFGGKVETKGLALVPLSIYFNDKGIAKVHLALGKGRAKYDKREVEKKKEWQREKERVLRDT